MASDERSGDRPDEDVVLASIAAKESAPALRRHDAATVPTAASASESSVHPQMSSSSSSDSEDTGAREKKKQKKEKKRKHKHDKKKKHKKKHKKKKSKKRSHDSSSDSESGGPVQLSDFMRGSARTADSQDRYSSITGLKIQNNREQDEEGDARRARKLAKLNGGGQEEFQAWGDNMKRKKVTDKNALALLTTLRGIHKQGRGQIDIENARKLDEDRKIAPKYGHVRTRK